MSGIAAVDNEEYIWQFSTLSSLYVTVDLAYIQKRILQSCPTFLTVKLHQCTISAIRAYMLTSFPLPSLFCHVYSCKRCSKSPNKTAKTFRPDSHISDVCTSTQFPHALLLSNRISNVRNTSTKKTKTGEPWNNAIINKLDTNSLAYKETLIYLPATSCNCRHTNKKKWVKINGC